MIAILVFAAIVSLCAEASEPLEKKHREFARQQTEILRKEVERDGLPALARRSDQALDNLVRRGVSELHKRGWHGLANQKQSEWERNYRGYLSMRVTGYGDIGDHKPLSQWLADFYDAIEEKLGVTICKALHLSDIKTFNYAIPVVFNPCTFDMGSVSISRKDEYRNHFAEGAVYYGLMPVVTYWVVDIACLFGTSGIGVFFCGPIANFAEMACAEWIAPKLSDRVYDRACVQ